MIVYSGFVKVVSLVTNIICGLIVPVLENVAYKVRVGGGCECPSPISSYSSAERGRKHKKLKNSASGANGHLHHHSRDVNNIKLLLDITVAQNGGRVLDIHASTPTGDEQEYAGYRDYRGKQRCRPNPGLLLTLLNLPASILLWFARMLKQVAHSIQFSFLPAGGDTNRVKKSPKRRITRANYRKIIPFFPFNLLGFSNYSAFQMPTITRSSSSAAEEANNLDISNVSVNGINGKTRSKRRRSSSTEQDSCCSSLSDDDISYLNLPEKYETSGPGTGATNNATGPGHDEVDSDETADTVTKRITSSSSSDNNHLLQNHANPSPKNPPGNKFIVPLNTSTSEDNGGGGGNVTAMTDLDSSSGVVGEEHQVRFSFAEELNEAANESYNSADDPDYVPLESAPSSNETSSSSFATDKGCSDESFLLANGTTNSND